MAVVLVQMLFAAVLEHIAVLMDTSAVSDVENVIDDSGHVILLALILSILMPYLDENYPVWYTTCNEKRKVNITCKCDRVI